MRSSGPTWPTGWRAAHAVVTDAVEHGRVMYGVTTGFGALADTHVGRADLEQMQLALLRSHAAGVGTPLPDEVVRGLLLLRARTLTVGMSGVRVDLPRRLLELLDRGLLPVIPGKGSVGASGDLAQLAHLALPLVGEGRLRRAGASDASGQPANELLAEEGLEPLTLGPKEGLSLINGTEPMQVLLALAIAQAELLIKVADLACAMSLDGLLGTEPGIRPAGHRHPTAPRPARQRREHARAARRVRAARQPSARPDPCRAGLVLPALRTPGPRRGPRPARARASGPRPSSWARSSTTR